MKQHSYLTFSTNEPIRVDKIDMILCYNMYLMTYELTINYSGMEFVNTLTERTHKQIKGFCEGTIAAAAKDRDDFYPYLAIEASDEITVYINSKRFEGAIWVDGDVKWKFEGYPAFSLNLINLNEEEKTNLLSTILSKLTQAIRNGEF